MDLSLGIEILVSAIICKHVTKVSTSPHSSLLSKSRDSLVPWSVLFFAHYLLSFLSLALTCSFSTVSLPDTLSLHLSYPRSQGWFFCSFLK